MTLSMSAQSAALRHMGPTWSMDQASGSTPARLTRPYVGLSPVMPHSAAGMRMEPPVSEPSVPALPGGAVVRVEALGAEGELMHVELAEIDRPRGGEPRHHGGVLVGDPVAEDPRAPGRPDATGQVEVLQRDGHAVQRAQPIPR